jgi:hypothetical protein
VIAALEQLGIPYMLVGSFSSNMYGVPRATQDADLVLELGDRPIAPIEQMLGPGFHIDPQVSFEMVTATSRYVINYRGSGFIIELFLLSDDAHDRARFGRRICRQFAGSPVFLPTAEDVIITKLRWSKGGNRRKDVEDVENVLAAQGRALDLPYIRSWCDQHDTRELFEKLLAAAG